jgi:NAD(P)-dependent dehydrogenase (short-subunit alcohol dehydrogenase family)
MAVDIDLAGRIALVTGAGSGIGRACALLLAEAGAEVVIADLDAASARRTAGEITTAGRSARYEQLDITSVEHCAELAARYAGALAPSVLVNCAAIWTIGGFAAMDTARWQRDVTVTLHGPMILTAALMPAMCSLGGASVINIGSDAGRVGERAQVAYSAAKAGLAGFTKSLAREVGQHGVRVNCVSPGLTRTAGSADFVDAVPAEIVRRNYPLGRLGEPEDIANLVLFLASDRASWITGQIISVSGGYTMVG